MDFPASRLEGVIFGAKTPTTDPSESQERNALKGSPSRTVRDKRD